MRDMIGKSVVRLSPVRPVDGVLRSGSGTGFHVIAPSGKIYLMTNRHVCNMAVNGKLWAISSGNSDAHEVSVITSSDSFDLCLMTPVPGLSGIKVGSNPTAGQSVGYLGHPRGQPRTFSVGEVVGADAISINAGVIGKQITEEQCRTKDSYITEMPEILTLIMDMQRGSTVSPDLASHPLLRGQKKVRVCFQRNRAMYTTLFIYPGASGSPVIDFFGRLVGVVYAAPPQGGWGFAVMMSDIKTILNGR